MLEYVWLNLKSVLNFLASHHKILSISGNACHSVSGAVVSLTRSLTVVGLVYGFCYAALLEEVSHTLVLFLLYYYIYYIQGGGGGGNWALSD